MRGIRFFRSSTIMGFSAIAILSSKVFAGDFVAPLDQTINISNINFAAPVVTSEASMPTDLPAGTIIFDAASANFKGQDLLGAWQPLTAPSSNGQGTVSYFLPLVQRTSLHPQLVQPLQSTNTQFLVLEEEEDNPLQREVLEVEVLEDMQAEHLPALLPTHRSLLL